MEQSEFNTYKDGLDLRFLRDYCLEHGTLARRYALIVWGMKAKFPFVR